MLCVLMEQESNEYHVPQQEIVLMAKKTKRSIFFRRKQITTFVVFRVIIPSIAILQLMAIIQSLLPLSLHQNTTGSNHHGSDVGTMMTMSRPWWVDTTSTRSVMIKNQRNTTGVWIDGRMMPATSTVVQFLAPNDLEFPMDAYAGVWWQSRENFLTVDLNGSIGNAEGACFSSLTNREESTLMTVDWFDFSIEHLSKWWKFLEYDTIESEIPYRRITDNLLSYLAQPIVCLHYEQNCSHVPAMTDTLAVVAFSPEEYNPWYPLRGVGISVTVLAATVLSLVRQGCGRIVVAGEHETDWAVVQGAFSLIQHFQRKNYENSFLKLQTILSQVSSRSVENTSHLYSTEVSFIRVNATFNAFNEIVSIVPKAVLMALQEALKNESSFIERDLWLGSGRSAMDWKNIYYTEHDCILHTRSTALSQFRDELSKSETILVPHRLQPIWHESDLRGYEDNRYWIPATGIFSNVSVLNGIVNSSCCDGGIVKPMSRHGKCNNWWYMCGFEQIEQKTTNQNRVQLLVRLQEYALMRLTTGTGLVSLAATEHGRRCIPTEIGTCPPPAFTNRSAT